MNNISLIASVSQDYGLGKSGQLIWHIPEDMQFFRQTTTGHTVVMGRKTYESIGRPLPKRRNIVLSRGEISGDVEVCKSRAEIEQLLQDSDDEVFIIGGASLYEMFVGDANRILLTEVAGAQPADAFFPQFDKSLFDRTIIQTGNHEGVKYQIVEYRRKGSDER